MNIINRSVIIKFFMIFVLIPASCVEDVWPKKTIDVAPPKEGAQTAEQIEVEKVLADQAVIVNCPEKYKTPRKLFDEYFAAKVRCDAMEYKLYTTVAIRGSFGKDQLTDEDFERIVGVKREFKVADHQVIGFQYYSDENRPSIKCTYAYTRMGASGIRVWTEATFVLILVRTPDGWRIDGVEN